MYLCLAKGDHEDQPAKIVTSHEKQKSPHLQEKSASRPKGRVTYSVCMVLCILWINLFEM